MIDQTTANLGLPLPAASNDLSDDILRLRQAFTMLDAAVASKASTAQLNAALAAVVDSAPAAMDTIRELAAAIQNDPNYAANVAIQIAQANEKADVVKVQFQKMKVRNALGLGLFQLEG